MPRRPRDSPLPHPAVLVATFAVTGAAWWLAQRLRQLRLVLVTAALGLIALGG